MGDLTTLSNVKDWLGIQSDNTSEDTLLSRLITAVSAFVDNYLNRSILSANYVESYTVGSGFQLTPQNWPITAVSSLVVNGSSIPASPDGVLDGYVSTDKTIFLNGYQFAYPAFAQGTRYLNVVLSYMAGYASVPPDLEQAVIHLVSLRYKERERIGQRSKSLAGEVISFSVFDMPPDVISVLGQYKRIIV